MALSVDWLSLTVGPEASKLLLAKSISSEPGRGCQGFARSERREGSGGPGGSPWLAWRKWEPYQESTCWGKLYESWEWSGSDAAGIAWLHGGLADSRASRVDVAWDFACGQDDTPEALVESARAVFEGLCITDGIAGQGKVNTKYIGSPSSDRRIRVYRKDLEDPLLYLVPAMRVELQLRGDRAEYWWLVSHDWEQALAVAAGQVFEMTGWEMPAEWREDMERMTEAQRTEAQKLEAFLRQYGPQVAAWCEADVPLLALCQRRAETSSRFSAARIRKRLARLAAEGVAKVVAAVGGADLLKERAECTG